MITQEDIDAFKEEKREAQLHQFAAAALSGAVTMGNNVEFASRMAWKHATEMMILKQEYDK